MDHKKLCLQSYSIHQKVGSSCTCLNHSGIRWEVEKIETSLMTDEQYILISNLIKRQSDHDFPRGSRRNGLFDGTKCQSSEQKGNLFQLQCIAHTTNGSRVITKRSLTTQTQNGSNTSNS